MDLHEQLNLAINLATDHHSQQVDKAGQPYILHPLWVMNNVKTLKGKIVAVLHDIIEDTEVDIDDLVLLDFDEDIIEAIDILTKKKGQEYTDYIHLVGTNKLAREVKIADLKHNMDLDRLKNVTDKDRERCIKYKNARDYLVYIR